MFHRSERLLLRPIFCEDWPAIYQAINDAGVVRMLASAPWPYGEQDARDFASLPFNPRQPRFALTLPGENGAELIGCVGMDRCDEGLELGYWIARPYWAQGFATEAGNAVIKLAHMMGETRLHAGHAVDNPASGRVLEKIGFRPTGESREQFSKGRGEAMPVKRYVHMAGSGGRAASQPVFN